MGFFICNIQPLEANRLNLRRVRSLALGGMQGVLARHLPRMAKKDDGRWTLSAQDLLRLEGEAGDEKNGIFFDLASGKDSSVNLLQLIEASGRTASLITDAIFHFKVLPAAELETTAGVTGFVISDSRDRPESYEQMRLEGGFAGGNWAWVEPPQPLGATVLGRTA